LPARFLFRTPSWFRALPECSGALKRGQVVVIETDRAIEVGEVLIPLDQSPAVSHRSRALRPAGPGDLASSRRSEAMRPDRLLLCRQGLDVGTWPGELIDVEMTLDDRATSTGSSYKPGVRSFRSADLPVIAVPETE
jgi:hypothetical protein